MDKKYWVVNQLDSQTAEILIYGDIFRCEGYISAAGFVPELKALEKTCRKINIRINSNGGDVFEGITIFNAIRNSSCETHTYIDGMAASIASVIAMGGKKVFMSKYARLMTHRPSGGVFGSSEDLRKYADEIDSCEVTLNAIYAERTGLSTQEVTAKFLNGRDMFFTADAAINERLIDNIYDGERVDVPQGITDYKTMWNVYSAALQNKRPSNATVQFTNPSNLQSLNFKDLSPSQHSYLQTNDRALYDALYYLDHGAWPYSADHGRIHVAQIRIEKIKSEELRNLYSMSLYDLERTGKLDRLKNMDYGLYSAKFSSDDDYYGNRR